MAVTVRNILDSLNDEAPFALAESWDNVGLLVGNQDNEVTGVLAGLDPTVSLVEEAVAMNANTIVTHHPVIFKPLASINTATPEGTLLVKALSNNISIIGCHTNFDSAEFGVSDILGEKLGLTNLKPLIPSHDNPATGLGRIGTLPAPVNGREFISKAAVALNLSGLQVAGIVPDHITTVAVCGGSGSEFAIQARQAGADIYITAEIKHNIAVWAVENRFCVIDGTHYATEKPAVALLVEKLRLYGKSRGWNIPITETELEVPPSSLITL